MRMRRTRSSKDESSSPASSLLKNALNAEDISALKEIGKTQGFSGDGQNQARTKAWLLLLGCWKSKLVNKQIKGESVFSEGVRSN